jgi:hypothetical protein
MLNVEHFETGKMKTSETTKKRDAELKDNFQPTFRTSSVNRNVRAPDRLYLSFRF